MKAKKSLGQNFLKSEKALNQIIDSADVCADDIVLEIGPGRGVLTEKLLKLSSKVIAIEKDAELVLFLKEKFSKEIQEGRLDLIESDILEFNETDLKFYKKPYKLVANIPYYITGAIIRKFLETSFQPESMTLLLQKEVAERIVSRDKKESVLSISVKVYGNPKYIAKVSKRYFTPEPKVDSAIIYIDKISKDNFKNIKEEDFFAIVKAGFLHKRKFLATNLENLGISKEKILKVFEKLDIDTKIRPENVDLKTWILIVRELL